MALAVVVSLIAVPACSSGGKSADSVSAAASARSGSVVLRPGFALSWKDGVFSGAGTVSGAPVDTPGPPPPWFVADGRPVDVTVDGPRSGLLDVSWRPSGAPPSPDLVPVVLHWNEPTRSWDPIAIGDVAAGATGSVGSFSPHWPGWASPKKLADAVSGAVRDVLGKRTDPPGCSGGPSWAELSPPGVDVVLTCLATNRASDGTERAEVQLRNNRGYTLEVVVPAGVGYAFVDGQPELIRQAARAFTGRDSVLLSPGQLMTLGFTQPDVGAAVRIDAAPTASALAAYVIGKAIGDTDSSLAVIKVLADCALGTNVPFDVAPSIDSVGGVIRAAVGCFTGLFKDPVKAEQLALEVVGAQAGVDATTTASDFSLATKAAGLASKIRLIALAITAVDVGADLIDVVADNYVNSTAGDYTGMSTQLSLHGKTPARVDVSRFVGTWLAHASPVTIKSDGSVVISWFVNDVLATPPASGDVEIDLRVTGVTGDVATAKVTAVTIPPGVDPRAGPGGGPDLYVGDTYTLTLAPPGLVGRGAGTGYQWCDDAHYGQCGG